MNITRHSNTLCPVYLHPAVANSPAAVERIQRNTDLLVIVNLARANIAHTPEIVTADDQGPWGGDAA